MVYPQFMAIRIGRLIIKCINHQNPSDLGIINHHNYQYPLNVPYNYHIYGNMIWIDIDIKMGIIIHPLFSSKLICSKNTHSGHPGHPVFWEVWISAMKARPLASAARPRFFGALVTSKMADVNWYHYLMYQLSAIMISCILWEIHVSSCIMISIMIYIYIYISNIGKTLHSFWHVCWPMSTSMLCSFNTCMSLSENGDTMRYQKLPLPFFIPIGKWWSTTGFGGTLPVSMFCIFLVHHESCKCHANHANRQELLRIPNVRILKCNWRASLEVRARETSEKEDGVTLLLHIITTLKCSFLQPAHNHHLHLTLLLLLPLAWQMRAALARQSVFSHTLTSVGISRLHWQQARRICFKTPGAPVIPSLQCQAFVQSHSRWRTPLNMERTLSWDVLSLGAAFSNIIKPQLASATLQVSPRTRRSPDVGS